MPAKKTTKKTAKKAAKKVTKKAAKKTAKNKSKKMSVKVVVHDIVDYKDDDGTKGAAISLTFKLPGLTEKKLVAAAEEGKLSMTIGIGDKYL